MLFSVTEIVVIYSHYIHILKHFASLLTLILCVIACTNLVWGQCKNVIKIAVYTTELKSTDTVLGTFLVLTQLYNILL